MGIEDDFAKPPLYDKGGRIIDPEIAREAAEIEKKYHKRTLGLFRPSAEKIRKGERKAEQAIEKGTKIKLGEIPSPVKEEVERLNTVQQTAKKEWITIKEATIANIGDSITRFRLTGYSVGKKAIEDNFPIVTIAGGEIPMVFWDEEELEEIGETFDPDLADEIELIVDLKDDVVVSSEIKIVRKKEEKEW